MFACICASTSKFHRSTISVCLHHKYFINACSHISVMDINCQCKSSQTNVGVGGSTVRWQILICFGLKHSQFTRIDMGVNEYDRKSKLTNKTKRTCFIDVHHITVELSMTNILFLISITRFFFAFVMYLFNSWEFGIH